jgi:TPR repeat protein
MLGQIYRLGRGTDVDHDRAIEQYREAADDGHTQAMYYLGVELRDKGGQTIAERGQNERESFEWFEKASDAGDAAAHYAVALSYVIGKGVVRNYAKSGKYLVKAIEGGEDWAVKEMKTNSRAWHKDVLTTLQRYLRDEGLYSGNIDGDIGPGTIRAIEALYDRSQ